MVMHLAKRLRMVAGAVAVAGLWSVISTRCVRATVAAPEPPQDAGCKVMFDALDKLTSTPNHFYMTETGGAKNKPTSSEGILAGGIRYIKVDGKWMKSPMSSQEVQEQEQKNRQDAKNNYSCRYMRDESVQGESAVVYSAHQKNEDFTTDAQIWISKSKGLVLREEEDMDVGGGASGKSHLSVRYEYSNVQAPLSSQ